MKVQLKTQVLQLKEILTQFGRLSSLRDPLAPLWKSEGFQLTPVQVHMIMWLGADSPLPMGELAARVKTALPNCSRTTDRLVKSGLVFRDRDPEDRRTVLVRLSSEGERLYRRVDQVMEEQFALLLESLDEVDRTAFLAVLKRLVTRFSERVEQNEAHKTGSRESSPVTRIARVGV